MFFKIAITCFVVFIIAATGFRATDDIFGTHDTANTIFAVVAAAAFIATAVMVVVGIWN